MTSKRHKLIDYFNKHGGTVRFSEILKAGFHHDSINYLEKNGEIEKVGQGLYRIIAKSPASNIDIVNTSLQAPRGVICLISALYFHEVTTEIPMYVEIAIPRGTHANRIKYPPVKFYRISQKAWQAGIEEHKIEGNIIKVYNLAKTIADCFKFRNQIGINVAREALKTAITEKKAKPTDIMKYAKICRVDKIIKPILEAII